MKIGLIADIHGNTVALDLVLAELRRRSVDLVVCLGDIAAGGPDPGGAVDRVAELECVTVLGNTDAGMVDPPAWWRDPGSIDLPEAAWPAMETCLWGAEQLGADHRCFLAALPLTAEIEMGESTRLLAFHGSPTSFDGYLTAMTPDDDVVSMLGGADHDVLAGGHTHVQMMRRFRRQTIVNAGSVGLPFAEYGYVGGVPVLPQADFAVVTDDGAPQIELCSVPVDPEALAASVRRSGIPHGRWWMDQRTAG